MQHQCNGVPIKISSIAPSQSAYELLCPDSVAAPLAFDSQFTKFLVDCRDDSTVIGCRQCMEVEFHTCAPMIPNWRTVDQLLTQSHHA